jgi:hypothetical protein
MERSEAVKIAKMVSLSRGLYGRVARKMGCDVSYVSRIVRGERRFLRIEAAVGREFRTTLRKLNLHFGATRKDLHFELHRVRLKRLLS